ncbi:hypothetical protein BD410DRAFT_808712 [Rickenella mellea]|uniref:Uncharacterized protein n=1 Tax=Rickenella mellea TaxID=50990 RepID=A0A4Y7PKG8_9AGAM|nr:hypothetical protein BD410DRAFT_808712 [Rickenella mellea]
MEFRILILCQLANKEGARKSLYAALKWQEMVLQSFHPDKSVVLLVADPKGDVLAYCRRNVQGSGARSASEGAALRHHRLTAVNSVRCWMCRTIDVRSNPYPTLWCWRRELLGVRSMASFLDHNRKLKDVAIPNPPLRSEPIPPMEQHNEDVLPQQEPALPRGLVWSAISEAGLCLAPNGDGVHRRYRHPSRLSGFSPEPDDLHNSHMLIWLYTLYEYDSVGEFGRYTLKLMAFNSTKIKSLARFTTSRSVAVGVYEGRRSDPDAPIWLKDEPNLIDPQVHLRTKVVKTLISALNHEENAHLVGIDL